MIDPQLIDKAAGKYVHKDTRIWDALPIQEAEKRIAARNMGSAFNHEKPTHGRFTRLSEGQWCRPTLSFTLIIGAIGSAIFLAIGFALACVFVGAFLIVGGLVMIPTGFVMRSLGMLDAFVCEGDCPKCGVTGQVAISPSPIQNGWCKACKAEFVVRHPYLWIPD